MRPESEMIAAEDGEDAERSRLGDDEGGRTVVFDLGRRGSSSAAALAAGTDLGVSSVRGWTGGDRSGGAIEDAATAGAEVTLGIEA